MEIPKENGSRDFLKQIRRIGIFQSSSGGILIVILLLGAVLSLTTKDFFTMTNFNVLVREFSITVIVGLAQMVIISIGGMNLAVGAIGGLVGALIGGLMDRLGISPLIAIPLGCLAGMICGLWNGWVITRLGYSGVTSFLVTLAGASLFTGATLGITRANPFYNIPKSFVKIGNFNLFGISGLLFIMLVIAFMVDFLFRKLGLGKQLLAVGGNIKAAGLSGIPVNRVVLMAFIISGLLSAAAAILLVARLGSAQVDVGSDWMLASFAAPILGGCRLAGGKVTIVGTVLGGILLALIGNGIVFLNLNIYWTVFIQGLIILGAVGLDRIRSLSSAGLERSL
jgi:ribose transport system permease protein